MLIFFFLFLLSRAVHSAVTVVMSSALIVRIMVATMLAMVVDGRAEVSLVN